MANSYIFPTRRNFQFHCTESGRRLGGYNCPSWCTSLAYDEAARYVFVGDQAGSITVLKLDENGVKFVNTLKGHNGSVQTLFWESVNGWLFSGTPRSPNTLISHG